MNQYKVTFTNGISITVHCNNQWAAREAAKRKYVFQYGTRVQDDGGIPTIANVISIGNPSQLRWKRY